MIISTERQFVFVHIPKTGGTSMMHALQMGVHDSDILIGDTALAKARRPELRHLSPRGRLWKHATLADIDGIVSTEVLENMVCFTMVRNPWDRIVSYYHWLQEQSFAHRAVHLAQSLNFNDFATHPHTLISLQASPARHYMTDAKGIERCDLYIRVEYLDRDLAELEHKLDMQLHLPILNESNRRREWKSYYSRTAKRAIAQACAEDIRRFGYIY